MFHAAKAFNQVLNDWDVSNGTNFAMFALQGNLMETLVIGM